MEEPVIILSTTLGFRSHYRATRAIANWLWNTYVAWGFFVGVPLFLIINLLGRRQDICTPGSLGIPAWTVLLGGLLFMAVVIPLTQMSNVASMR